LLVEAYRLQGVLLLHQAVADAVQAEACFQQALTIARRQQAKPGSYARPQAWCASGSSRASDRARALLAPIYDWFTEGFDTADLQDARALLEALGEPKHEHIFAPSGGS
jgi:predicted ATPase